EERKKKWLKFAKDNDNMTLSKLLRTAVEFYINVHSMIPNFKSFSKITHDLKEPLTSINGIAHILIEKYKDNLDSDILFNINEILERSKDLEQKITEILEIEKIEDESFDILIVDDDMSTIKVLCRYFDLKGFSCKGMNGSLRVLDEIRIYQPKVVLLDVILPEIDGFDLCKKIRDDDEIKDTPVYFITAIPGYEIEKKIPETGADGYFLKPFNFQKLEMLIKQIRDK
ncbi:response regulator, partial [Candidatus Bathyarchaeota archaeon]|nr:response regulator [Candidatus Bathyarchaeota archaeon]